MTTPVLIPQMGLEVSEATVLEVLVAVGDEVVAGQPVLEIETEKATTEVLAPCDGFVVEINVESGDSIGVGAAAAHLGESRDEPIVRRAPVHGDGDGATAPAAAANRPDSVDALGGIPSVVSPSSASGRLRAAPVARRAAQKLGVNLEAVAGTGPRGRITLSDVESAANRLTTVAVDDSVSRSAGSLPTNSEPGVEPLSTARAVTAKRMTISQTIPQYHLERDVVASHLLAQKTAIAEALHAGVRPGVSDLLIQAIAKTVSDHPSLATTYVDGDVPAIRRQSEIGVGLAVASPHGLMVPVIRGADTFGISEIAATRTSLVQAARAGRLSIEQMSGAVITLSNLGAFGVDRFVALLNPGESAIVAIGRIVDRVVPRGRGMIVVPILTVTMTFDHRAIDGAEGGAALNHLAELLEGQMIWKP